MKNNYSASLASDVIRGSRNLGRNRELNNLSSDDLINLIKDYVNKYGQPENYNGMLVWSNVSGNTYSLSAYKNNKPFNPEELNLNNALLSVT
jgi:hypothetical protein